MGQYYKPIFLNENNKPISYAYSHDFGSGLKLMEHSWMLNPFVRFIENQLMLQAQKLVWAGDYADNENPKTITSKEIKALSREDSEYWNAEILKKEGINLYSLSELVGKISHDETIPKNKNKYDYKYKKIAPTNAKYLINYDKKEFVNKTKVPKDNDGWKIHPLPLLTCEGNGRGGGDFRGDEVKLVGRWSRDKIGVVTKKTEIPKDFKEIIFDLTE
tara:strand:- start:749 stop:1399 length:651 start_codon:yes stop_codon:yes gene_type:complete